jgi:hypothetical protein
LIPIPIPLAEINGQSSLNRRGHYTRIEAASTLLYGVDTFVIYTL